MMWLKALILVGLSAIVPQTAAADGTVNIKEKVTYPVYLFLDGAAVGRVKKEHIATLSAGPHELWFTMDEEGIYTYCHGTVDVVDGQPLALTVKSRGCEGFTAPDALGSPTHSKGSAITFRFQPGDQFCCDVQVDASGKYSFPLTPARSLNLAPGEHHLLIGDNQSSASKDQGIVTTEAGKTATLTCSETGCIGLRHP